MAESTIISTVQRYLSGLPTVGVREFQEDDTSPLIHMARKEGIVIRPLKADGEGGVMVAEDCSEYAEERE